MKQKEMARWLKVIDVFAAVLGLLLCTVIAPLLGQGIADEYPELSMWYWPTLVYLWVAAVPVFIALWHAWRIFTEIGKDNSFSLGNARRLGSISKLALLETALVMGAALFLLVKNLLHPSLMIAMLFALFLTIGASVAAAALSHLVEKAYMLKQENDLTV